MKTLKQSRQLFGTPISLRALCQVEDRKLPYSLLDVVADNEFRHFNGRISTGDVHCIWAMQLWKNGFWSVAGDFHDDGILAGDFFAVEFMMDDVHSIGARLSGSIIEVWESRSLSLNTEGSDHWVRDNWHKFESSGPTVSLHAAPAVGSVVLRIGVLLLIAVGIVFAKTGTKRGFAHRSGTPLTDPTAPPPNDTRPGIEFEDEEDDDP